MVRMLGTGVMQEATGTVVVVIVVDVVTVDVARMMEGDAGVMMGRLLLRRLDDVLLLVQMMRPSALLRVWLLVTRSRAVDDSTGGRIARSRRRRLDVLLMRQVIELMMLRKLSV